MSEQEKLDATNDKKELIRKAVSSNHKELMALTRKTHFVFGGDADDIKFVTEQMLALLESAESIFHMLPSGVRDRIATLHTFEGSIQYCLRAGITACEEAGNEADALAGLPQRGYLDEDAGYAP